MKPLEAIFGAAVDIRNRLYDRGELRTQRLQAPVVSIGNISVGGAGKTPFLILLGELLKKRGVEFDVLSRGYRRATKGVRLVDPAGTSEEFGDEPILIARKLGVPVIVGEDRFEAGKFAEQKHGPWLHLLDDGFQHRRLARDFDIVLVSGKDLRDRLIPGGRLREPTSSLARADAIVLDAGSECDDQAKTMREVWRVRRGLIAPGTRTAYFAFCGVARPENFFSQLRAAGVSVSDTRCFRDHHRYSPADVQQLLQLRTESGAAAFVTTEKDAVNLGKLVRDLQPIEVVGLRMELLDAEDKLNSMLSCIAQRRAQARETI